MVNHEIHERREEGSDPGVRVCMALSHDPILNPDSRIPRPTGASPPLAALSPMRLAEGDGRHKPKTGEPIFQPIAFSLWAVAQRRGGDSTRAGPGSFVAGWLSLQRDGDLADGRIPGGHQQTRPRNFFNIDKLSEMAKSMSSFCKSPISSSVELRRI